MKFRNSIVIMICMAALMNMKDDQTKEVHVLKMPEEIAAEQVSIETKEVKIYDSLEMLAKCVQAEAGNQGLLGKRLVVDVILNRVDSDRFPNTIEGVITQSGQFAVYPYMLNKAVPDDETISSYLHGAGEQNRLRHPVLLCSQIQIMLHTGISTRRPLFWILKGGKREWQREARELSYMLPTRWKW